MSDFKLSQEDVDTLASKTKLFYEQTEAAEESSKKALETVGEMITQGEYAPRVSDTVESINKLDKDMVEALEEGTDAIQKYFTEVASITGIEPRNMK